MATNYLTVAEVLLMEHRLVSRFGGLHGVRDKHAIEAAVFRPQSGYYNSLAEEAAALMESLANNNGFIDGNKLTAFATTGVFLELNGFYMDVTPEEGVDFIDGSMERKEFRFVLILDWIQEHIQPLQVEEVTFRPLPNP